MKQRVQAWFNALESRQQLLLLGLALVLLVWLLLQLAWRPMAAESERLRQRNAQTADSLAWMQQAAAEYRRLAADDRPAARASNAPLSRQINASAQRAGVLVNRLQPAGDDEARVWIEDVAFDKAMQLLYQLETESGIKARSLTINGSDKSGLVSLQGALVRGE